MYSMSGLFDPFKNILSCFIQFINFFRPAAEFFTRSMDSIGGKYRKSRFVQFTDRTFTTRVRQEADYFHLGFLGPVLKAEVCIIQIMNVEKIQSIVGKAIT